MKNVLTMLMVENAETKKFCRHQLERHDMIGREWISKQLPAFLSMYFKGTEIEYVLQAVEGVDDAKGMIAGEQRFDCIVFPADYKDELLELILDRQPQAKIMIVHDRKLSGSKDESGYWIGDLLTLLTWTNYQEFERLMLLGNLGR